MKTQPTTLQSVSGAPLHVRSWKPENGTDLAGSVVIVHGLAEHGGRYHHVARHFTDHGFAVYGPDLVGFGRSGGRRGHVPGGLNTYVKDVLLVADTLAQSPGERSRQILLGHSMGGTVVLRMLLENPERFREAIVCAPALNPGRGISPMRRLALRVMSTVLPKITIDHGYRASQMSTDPEAVAAYKDDPLVHRRISLGLVGSISRQSKQIRQAAEGFDAGIALLLLQGGLDTIAHPEDARRFGERLACKRKQTHVFPGMKHEVFHEMETEKTFRAVDAFLGLPIDQA